MSGRPARLREAVTVATFAAAWRGVRLLPEPVAYRLFDAVADLAHRRDGRGVRRLRDNLARAVPTAGADQLDALTREGMRSYLRYWCEAFRLPDWDERRVVSTVRPVDDHHVRDALAAGRGVVTPLGHMGNWDHAGAWSTYALAPLTTVAERLRPEALFLRFLAFRERLGMTVIANVGPDGRAADITARLTADLADGAFVALLADRDLSGRGVQVQLLGEPARLAGGPAVLAARSGAALVPATISYAEDESSPSGWLTVVRFHPEVPVSDDTPDAVAAATQQVADVLGEGIRSNPQDWHMLQSVFVADVGREPRARAWRGR